MRTDFETVNQITKPLQES